jgi:glycerol-3-phosphate cytidylyltransferase
MHMINLNQKSKRRAYKVGYTTGVFDLFHIGHLTLLRNASALCDHLIVGVSTDDLVKYKGKKPVIQYADRAAIVEGIRFVDQVIPQSDLDKVVAWRKIKFDVLFVGDDWYENPSWIEYEKKLKEVNVQVVYLPYTKSISSTKINEVLNEKRRR